MTDHAPWMLPEGIEEILPPETWRLERLRRRLLDRFHAWGYDLIAPPLVEYLDALLTGAGHDMDVDTVKFVDQLSGRMLGVRADMTPQAARIDAHQLKRDAVVRLCYLGPVLRARPDQPGAARNPLQLGAELYGHRGAASDVEMISLLLEILHTAGIEDVYLDLGHTGIFRGLAKHAGLGDRDEDQLFDLLQCKAIPEIEAFLDRSDIDAQTRTMLSALPRLNGDMDVLDKAEAVLAHAPDEVRGRLADLRALADALVRDLPRIGLHVDLAELRGYRYQTGVVFAAYVPGHGREVARGGRYDAIGRMFGREREATGFSADMKTLLALASPAEDDREEEAAASVLILAPARREVALETVVNDLRRRGRRVVNALDVEDESSLRILAEDMGCGQILAQRNGEWEPVSVQNAA